MLAKCESSVLAKCESSVFAKWESSVVTKWESSVVTKWESSVVTKWESSVVAKWESSVVAKWESSVVAKWESSVVAKWESSVVAKWESSVVAKWESGSLDRSKVEARRGTEATLLQMFGKHLVRTSSCDCGCVASWLRGCVAVWLCGFVASWLRGFVASWLCGCVAVWLCGCVASWLRGFVASWLRGFVASWLCGFVASWLRGCVAVWHHSPRITTLLETESCHVMSSPRITTLLETLDILLDHNATFICEVDSRPPADVTWTRNNHPIPYYDSRYTTRENGQMLLIPNVRESDNGEYCCVANNGIGEPAKSCGALQLKMKPQIKRHPTNMTLLIESKAVLPCVTLGNPKPDISWIKDDALMTVSDRITILDYGALKIHNIKKEDAGQYRCVAKNSFGIAFSKPVSIEVQAPARILRVPKDKRVTFGSEVSLECNATGNPIPAITWLENGNTVPGGSVEETLVGEVILSVLHITVTKPARYTCLASNRHSAGAKSAKSSAGVTVQEWRLYKGSAGYCGAYRGNVCRSMLRSDALVFFNSSLNDPEDTQEFMAQSAWADLDRLGMLCSPAAHSLLCHLSFQDCIPSGLGPAPKPICREHCLAVKELYCHKEWPLMVGNSHKGLYSSGSSGLSIPLPDCMALPSQHTTPGACTPIPFVDIKKDQVTTTCYNDKGRFYQGPVNITSSGIPCQRWSQQGPHLHRLSVDVLSELRNAQSSCRNPGGENEKPWCYTTNPNIRWEYCNIPKCGEVVVKTESSFPRQNPPLLPPSVSPAYSMIIIICLLAAFAAIAFLTIIIIMCKRRRKTWKNHKTVMETPTLTALPSESLLLDRLHPNPMYQRLPLLLNSKLMALEYPRNNIEYVRDIGEGAFGRVFQAR
ncbi:muscle, skeletal receptor tyrosine protein kinase-like [Salvelinus namaycush]|uniref:Muscle, skeletal receptor tyrosine protein kinase-like n=1 Tax=Salvelinus namaycush TaxID=8040 RepID=A0A8U0U426_SALNM|nr:muscle, skeletal receptor tyrosine protein kinase-like [Salvelinus namaycush]